MLESENTENHVFQVKSSSKNDVPSQELRAPLKQDAILEIQTGLLPSRRSSLPASTGSSLPLSSQGSSLNYCYEDDCSTVYTPVSTPREAANHNIHSRNEAKSSGGYISVAKDVTSKTAEDHSTYTRTRSWSMSSGGYLSIAKEATLTPSPFHQQNRPFTPVRLHSEITEQMSNLKATKTFHNYPTIDRESSDSSIFSSSLRDEDLDFINHGSISNHGGSTSGGGDEVLENRTLDALDIYDHGGSLRRFPTWPEEEKEEIQKDEIACEPSHTEVLRAETTTEQRVNKYHQADNKAEYIQNLYSKVIAANNSDSKHDQQNDDHLIDMMRESAIHNHKYNEIVSNQVFGYRSNNDCDDQKGLIPNWVVQSTPAIKFMIVISSALLMGSMALILIAFSVSVKNRAGTSQQTNFNEFTNAPTPSALWFDMPSTSNSTMNPLTSDSPSSQPSSKEEKTGIPKGPIELNNTSPTPSPLTILSSHQPSMLSISMLPTVKSVGPISLQPAEPMTSQSKSPSLSPTFDETSSYPTNTQSENSAPSLSPSSEPSPLPSVTVTDNPSSIPSNSLSPSTSPSLASVMQSVGKFYVTSRNKRNSVVSKLLDNLPANNDQWMIHLGNWNMHSNGTNHCRSGVYERVSQMYLNSSIPVFFLPGDNEWNDCDDFPASAQRWRQTFVKYEQNWNPLAFQVSRQQNRPENFSFVFKKAIYIGLNMVAGQIKNSKLWRKRLYDNLDWVRVSVEDQIDELEVVLIFGNSGNLDSNKEFFLQLRSLVEEWNNEIIRVNKQKVRRHLPFFYIKQNQLESKIKENFMDQSDFVLVNVHEGIWPPAKFSVNTENKSFTLDKDWN